MNNNLGAARHSNNSGVFGPRPNHTFLTSGIRFSQTTVNPVMGNGMTVSDAANQIREVGYRNSGLAPIDVVDMGGGRFTTVDNRRLTAARMSGTSTINAVLYQANDPYRQNVQFANNNAVQSVSWSEPGLPLHERTAGDFVNQRICSQRLSVSEGTNRNNSILSSLAQGGFSETPRINSIRKNCGGALEASSISSSSVVGRSKMFPRQ